MSSWNHAATVRLGVPNTSGHRRMPRNDYALSLKLTKEIPIYPNTLPTILIKVFITDFCNSSLLLNPIN